MCDIANIMASVGVIAKLHSENQRVLSISRSRPMFKWIYPLRLTEILHSVDDVDAGQLQNEHKMKFLLANASGSNIRAEINLMPPHTSTLSVTVQAGADRGTVTKQTSANWSKCCD